MKRVALLLCGTVFLSGCSVFASGTQSVTITSHPEAVLYLDGVRVGKGTAVVNVTRDDSHVAMAKLDDQTAMISIGTKLSTTGILDIVGGIIFLIPLVGLLTPGAWSPDHQAITLHIERANGK